MHAGMDQIFVDGRDAARAAANPAGSVFIDAGNTAPSTDAAGTAIWGPDAHVLGGKRVRGRFAVAGTDDDALFASRRQGKAFAYNVPVAADGRYTLSLLFVDTLKKPGKRLFHVDAEGQRLETDLDVVARAGGPRTALVLTHDVTVTGGTFDLALSRAKGAAVLSGFSIVFAGPVVEQPPPPVAQPPAAPGGLTATAQSPTSVALSWSDNSSDETGFSVERATGAGAFLALATLPAGATIYRDAAAAAGTAYVYRVRAFSLAGSGAASNDAFVTTPSSPTDPPPPPPPPATPPVAPSGLAAVVTGATAVSLTWADNSADETAFVVERSANGGAFATLVTLPAGSTGHLDTGVSPGSSYAYRVRATNGAGPSDSSNAVQVTIPTPPGGGGATDAPTNLASTAATDTTLDLTWIAPADAGAVTEYRITYAPGEYDPGPAGQWQMVEVPGSATGVRLSNLLPFALYSIDVAAVRAGAAGEAAHVNAWTAKPAGMSRYLYLVDLPKDATGFPELKPQIEVFDIEDGHRWVRNIPLPTGIYNVRGVAANARTGRLYVSYFLTGNGGYQPGGLLCLDMNTDQVLWRRDYPPEVVPSPDRFDITPDGAKIYMPVGEHGPDRFWVVIDAANGDALGRIYHTTAPHNTIVSLDGRLAFLEGQEKGEQPADVLHTIGVVDTATDQVIQKIGPFRDVVRPFTVNGSATLVFATVNDFVGFQVGDVRTGEVLYTAPVPGATQPPDSNNTVVCHGISLSPDEREVWIVDTQRVGLHVFDVSGVRDGEAPRYVKFVQTRRRGRDLNGNPDPDASRDAAGIPAWLNRSHDGKYVYAELGEVIDAATKRVVGQLRAKELNGAGQLVDAPYSHSRFMIEVDVIGGRVVRATDQFGVGLVK
jgi:hypothetical protein